MTTTRPTLAAIAAMMRRTLRLHRDTLDAVIAYLLEASADHIPDHIRWADDALAVATARRLQSVEAEDVLDDDVVRDISRLRALLAAHHPDIEDILP